MDYPSRFPKPLLSGYSTEVLSGVMRTGMTAGNYKQRRLRHNMPEYYNLRFAVMYADFFDWQNWVNENAYDFFNLPFVSSISNHADRCAMREVRFISDLEITQGAGGFIYAGVRVEAVGITQFIDSAHAARGWIIAQTPAAPSDPDWYIAGTPDAPSTQNWVLSGSLAIPSVVV